MIEQQVAEGVGRILSSDSGVTTVLGLLCLALGWQVHKKDKKIEDLTDKFIAITVEYNKTLVSVTTSLSTIASKLDDIFRAK